MGSDNAHSRGWVCYSPQKCTHSQILSPKTKGDSTDSLERKQQDAKSFMACLLSVSQRTLFNQKKFNLIFRKIFFFLALFVFQKVVFKKPLSKLSCICLPLEKLVNGKHFSVKEKFGLVSRKVFSFYFGRKTLSGSCEKFKNVILFVDYIKFGPQTFDCYIYFVLNICFSISSLRI